MSATLNISPRRIFFQWMGTHWFATFLLVYGAWVFIPFLAPLFMQLGWTGVGKVIYFIYPFFCHQLPERSFFLFGQKTMYSLSEIQAVGQYTLDPFVLRTFVGNPEMGWKVAWSDRMISFLTVIVILLSTAISACSTQTQSNDLHMLSMDEMPAEVQSAPVTVQTAYQFAAANPNIMKDIPCYCGCGNVGHTSG